VDENKFNPSISAKKVLDEYSLEDKKVVGFIGSFHYWHGIDHIQSLILDVLNQCNDTVFIMVGHGPLKNNLECFVAQEGITNKVFLPGYIEYNDIPFYLAGMDIVIAPYPNYEFFYYSPIKIFEYMAAGKCVVATAIGQIKEVIDDGINGMLFQPGNYDEMVQKTFSLLKNNSLQKKIGKAARNTIENNYTWRHTAEKLNRVISGVMA
jgi:glycosyltransferase involved in cell wall biosynthesis